MATSERDAKKRRFINNLRKAFQRIGIDTGHGFAAYLAERYEISRASTGEWLNEEKSFPSRVRLEQIAADTGITVDELLNGFTNTEEGPDIRDDRVPIIGWTTAGTFRDTETLQPYEVEEYVASTKAQNGYRFALRIVGQSMEDPNGKKSVPDGSIVIFNAERTDPETGDLVLARLFGEVETTFKRFVRDAGKVWLEPLNPRYPIITDKFEVIATAEEMVQQL